MTAFPKLFEPGCIGKLKLTNRFLQAPLATAYANPDGSVNQRLLNYYRERAKGGVSLIIVEFAYIDKEMSLALPCQLGIYDEDLIPGLSTLARVIKDNGAKAGIQIVHAGRQRYVASYPRVAPSPIPLKALSEVIPAELTTEQIKWIIEAYGNAARIAEQSGFDMVEIHGSHGYLITEFLSARMNKRSDRYGGDLQARIRFALEVLGSVKRNVSKDFPVGMRISASEFLEDGITIDESKVFAQELEKAGLDIIHVSAAVHETGQYSASPMYIPLATHAKLAEAIKKIVHIPVVASGSITNPTLAEDILRKGQADFVSMARPLLADPHFTKKAEEERDEDITPCIRCNDGCFERGEYLLRAVCCTVNVAAGFEGEFEIKSGMTRKKIAIIGGGPGGMEAARVAAMKGHDVILYEQRDRLGGSLIEASVPRFKKDLARLIDYLSTQVVKLGVRVILGEEATAATVEENGFDAVILAAGSKPLVPKIPGIERHSVKTAIEVLRGNEVGNNVIVVGGGLVGCEVAWFLAETGRKLRIIESLDNVAQDMERRSREIIIEQMSNYAVQIHTGLMLKEISDDGVTVVDTSKKKYEFEADSIVLALGLVSRKNLLEQLHTSGIAVYPVGDCIKPRRIYDAIHEGFFASYHL